MNVLRRRQFNKADAPSYIKDGLILHLVGDDATTAAWVNRITEETFTMYNTTKSDDEKGVVFNGTSAYAHCSTKNFGSGAEGTIEIVCNANNFTGTEFVVSQRNDYISFIAVATGDFYCELGLTTSLKIGTFPGKHTICLCRNKGYKDGVALNIGNNYNVKSPSHNGILIGRRSLTQTQYFNGTIYQIRIYDRVLTNDEILYNQLLDKKTYNI